MYIKISAPPELRGFACLPVLCYPQMMQVRRWLYYRIIIIINKYLTNNIFILFKSPD